jgi:hypothetical protein
MENPEYIKWNFPNNFFEIGNQIIYPAGIFNRYNVSIIFWLTLALLLKSIVQKRVY